MTSATPPDGRTTAELLARTKALADAEAARRAAADRAFQQGAPLAAVPPLLQTPSGDPEEEPPTPLEQMRAALLDSAGLSDIPEPDPLVADLLYTNGEAWLVGKAGHGKSFVAIDIAGCVGTGTDWHGHRVVQGDVLYVAAEGATGMRRRVRAWEASYGQTMSGVRWLPVAVQVKTPAWATLCELAAELQPALIVLDTQARITVGLEENSAMDMGEFVHRLEQLRAACGACVAVVHHQGRSGEHMRGSTAMDGAADSVITVSKDGDLVTVKNPKQKDAEQHEDIELRLVPIAESAVLMIANGGAGGDHSGAMKTAGRWWNLFAGDEVSVAKVVDAEVTTKATFYRHVAVLLKAGIAGKTVSGRSTYYRLLRDPSWDSPAPMPAPFEASFAEVGGSSSDTPVPVQSLLDDFERPDEESQK